jgi:hypothetical protein
MRLVKQGYEIKQAANGDQALEAFSDENFDLLILDIIAGERNELYPEALYNRGTDKKSERSAGPVKKEGSSQKAESSS